MMDEDAACAAVLVGLRRGLMLAEVARSHGRSERVRAHIRGILADLAPELAELGVSVRFP